MPRVPDYSGTPLQTDAESPIGENVERASTMRAINFQDETSGVIKYVFHAPRRLAYGKAEENKKTLFARHHRFLQGLRRRSGLFAAKGRLKHFGLSIHEGIFVVFEKSPSHHVVLRTTLSRYN